MPNLTILSLIYKINYTKISAEDAHSRLWELMT